VRARLELLDQPLFPPRALREDRHDLTVPGQPHGGVDRLLVTLAPVDLERTAEPENRPERGAEELGLGHEAQLPVRKEGPTERPRVEIGHMVGRKDIATLARKMLLPLDTQTK
jgi:hypothetical protein